MDADSSAASVSVSTAKISYTVASTLYSSTTHLDWDSKVWTLLLYIRESSRELLPLCFNSLV